VGGERIYFNFVQVRKADLYYVFCMCRRKNYIMSCASGNVRDV